MTKPFQAQSIAWAKKNLLALDVGSVLKFVAEPKRHRAVRKQASVTGEENGMKFSVSRCNDVYQITRMA